MRSLRRFVSQWGPTILLVLAALAGALWAAKPLSVPQPVDTTTVPTLSATGSVTATASPFSPTPKPAPPTNKLLSVPFTPQAPFGSWDPLHDEACEEASAIIAGHYFSGERAGLLDPSQADREIIAMVDWEIAHFGTHKDLTLDEEVQLVHQFYPELKTSITTDVSLKRIQKEIAAGNLIIVPAAGRQLHNPYFKTPGPIYHMLVVIGYKGGTIITNDPGTKRGAGFEYAYNTLLDATHDWNGSPENIDQGPKKMLIISR